MSTTTEAPADTLAGRAAALLTRCPACGSRRVKVVEAGSMRNGTREDGAKVIATCQRCCTWLTLEVRPTQLTLF